MHNLMMAKTAFRLDGQSQRARNGSGGELVLRTWGKGVGRHPDCHQDSWTSSETLSPNLSFDNMNCIDPYAGCSDILLLIINDVTDLRRELTSTAIPGLPISLESLMEENIQWFHTLYLRLKATLENLPQILPSLTEEGNIENERRRRALEGILLATSEAHRYAALVLLEETVSLASKCSSSISGPWNDGDGPFSGYDPQDRDLYVVRTIELVQTVVNLTETGLTAVWPLWPLFIAGCITDDRRYRRLVLELFEGVLSRTPFRVHLSSILDPLSLRSVLLTYRPSTSSTPNES